MSFLSQFTNLKRQKYSIKYGFPIDVVKLDILNKDQNANEVALERDLKMAISEYAPGSSVVANAKIWKSAGLKSLKDQAWPIYEYLFCPNCGQFNINSYIGQSDDSQSEFSCVHCKSDLKNESRNKFIDPIFGFLTARPLLLKQMPYPLCRRYQFLKSQAGRHWLLPL